LGLFAEQNHLVDHSIEKWRSATFEVSTVNADLQHNASRMAGYGRSADHEFVVRFRTKNGSPQLFFQ
jgi:hypothetical protein